MDIQENFRLDKDKYQWILYTRRDTKSPKGEDKEQWKPTYHSNLFQVAKWMINRGCEDCTSIRELANLMENSTERLASSLEIKVREKL